MEINNLESAKDAMREIFASLDLQDSHELLKWAQEYLETTPPAFISKSNKKEKIIGNKKRKRLEKIAEHLKDQRIFVPSNNPGKVVWPKAGYDSECTEKNTLEIDMFLYDDDDVEELVENNVITRNYCNSCGSRDTNPLNFISHSLSREQIEFIFTKLISSDVNQILDIGSRIGAVVYGSSIFTDGNVKSVGVEMDSELVTITKNTIKQFGLKNIEIHNDDIRHLPEVVESSQFIVMNNVFSFFLTKSEQEDCWEFLYRHVRPGAILVHHPNIELSTDHLSLSFKIDDWIELVDTSVECVEFGGYDEDVYKDVESVKKYIVKNHDK